jgi:selenocysteine-specific elongation factor
VSEYLSGTFLEDAPIIPVSGVKGDGIPDLIAALDELAGRLEEQPASGPFRLPVDRVFSMKGFGTVITGTAIGGQVEVGQELMIYPQGLTSRVRGLQVHNQEVKSARRGQRTAINLQGLDKENIERGNVLATPGSLVSSLWLDLQIKVLDETPRPIKHRAPIRFHAGSVELMGRVLTLDRDDLKPGDDAFCQVRLDEPVALMAGDRYVLRSYSPVFTIAGGVIMHPHPGRHKRNRPEIIADLETLRSGQDVDKVAVMARLAGERGVTAGELVRLVALAPKELDALLNQMLSKQELVRFDKEGGRLIAEKVQAELMQRALELVGQYHEQQPLKPGMPREELKQRLGRNVEPKLFAHLLNKLTGSDELVAERDLLRLPKHKVRLAEDDAKLRGHIEQAYKDGGLAPPNLKDVIAGEDPKQAKQIVGVLVNQGVLTRIKEDLYYHTPALEEIQRRLVEYLQANERISTPQFKEMVGLSRKYIIPLLEHFDTKGLTMRLGDERVLRKT